MRWVGPLKILVFILCLLPLAWLMFRAFNDGLGANPIEAIIRETGLWTLRLLLLTLAMTPLRRLTGWSGWLQLRRMLGLFAFFYASMHLMGYIWLDQFFDWSAIWEDIIKRPFITVGLISFLLLIPLAATSTKQTMKMLGRRWQRLHRLIYLIALGGVVHYWWLVKADLSQPMLYAIILLVLMLFRLPWPRRKRPASH